MADLISRQDAINAITEAMLNHDSAIMRIYNLPSVQPRKNKKHWIGNYTPYKCDRCGHYSDTATPFCAWCGDDKRGDAE